ncbi:unnamed protein product [Ambrosiozyma monospora]|uniref:Unnamed protein product n=1 Tax=Ambrosiozyma monospora TaxID=43982 RepID=A0ACB5SVA6_AMBMO|nr:unnamed protein product [Ambrosiozyma monospora]
MQNSYNLSSNNYLKFKMVLLPPPRPYLLPLKPLILDNPEPEPEIEAVPEPDPLMEPEAEPGPLKPEVVEFESSSFNHELLPPPCSLLNKPELEPSWLIPPPIPVINPCSRWYLFE